MNTKDMTVPLGRHKRSSEEKKKFPYRLTLWDIENSGKTRAWFSQKGAELWYCFAERGYVCLQWHNQPTDGYYFKLADIKKAMQKLGEEGLFKKEGYFGEERFYY